jgi:hypothetical protein
MSFELEDAELDVARRAYVETHGRSGESFEQRRVLDGTNTVEDSIGLKDVQRIGDTLRTEKFTGVGRGEQTATLGHFESPGEWCRWEGGLVSVEPELTTPAPASSDASCAVAMAASGPSCRLAATMSPNPIPN